MFLLHVLGIDDPRNWPGGTYTQDVLGDWFEKSTSRPVKLYVCFYPGNQDKPAFPPLPVKRKIPSLRLQLPAKFDNQHTWYHCTCGKTGCVFCDGGLAECTICGGMEGTLTTTCPGRKIPESILNAVRKGYIDFEHGRWVPGQCWFDGKLHTMTETVQQKGILRWRIR